MNYAVCRRMLLMLAAVILAETPLQAQTVTRTWTFCSPIITGPFVAACGLGAMSTTRIASNQTHYSIALRNAVDTEVSQNGWSWSALYDVDFAVAGAPSSPFSYAFKPTTPVSSGPTGGMSGGTWQVYEEWNRGGYRISLLGALFDPFAGLLPPRPFEGIGSCSRGTTSTFQDEDVLSTGLLTCKPNSVVQFDFTLDNQYTAEDFDIALFQFYGSDQHSNDASLTCGVGASNLACGDQYFEVTTTTTPEPPLFILVAAGLLLVIPIARIVNCKSHLPAAS